ncbi:hypothetical protein V1478_011008 [Vespula squamosa]|uniref:Uncharacterized protein n=1 Tax=Vespula squamosa TaxID=30214 RepID=A0ABD2AFY9_VESSQ
MFSYLVPLKMLQHVSIVGLNRIGNQRSLDKNHCNCPVPLEKFYTNNVIEDELVQKKKKKRKKKQQNLKKSFY